MDVTIRSGLPHERRVGAAAFFMFEGESAPTGAAARFDRASGGALTRLLTSGDFAGRWLEAVVLYPTRGSEAPRVLVVGLGPRSELTRRPRAACSDITRSSLTAGNRSPRSAPSSCS